MIMTKSKTKSKDTPKGKTEKESIPKEPLIIEPLGKTPYPRMEVTVDTTSCTVGVRLDAEDKNLKRPGYGSPNVRSILQLTCPLFD